MNKILYRLLLPCILIGLSPAQDAIDAPSVSEYGVEKLMSGLIPTSGEQYKGIVKVEVDTLNPDYSMPWQPGDYRGGIGTAFLIGKRTFLTNAHVVSNAERINISQYGSSRKIPARVKYVAHDSDLALLEVAEKDFAPFAELPYLELSKELPKLEDEVRAIGYPIGGSRLSVTRGVVSRIDFIPYSHPRVNNHLAVQIDAAINPGNSGGPVLMGNKVIGVAFQGITNANSTGYVIPIPVIKRFLQDIKDGQYDEYTDLGITLFPISNPAMRKALGLPDDEKGVLVGNVAKGASSDGILQTGDVIMNVDGYEVDSSGMIRLDGENISMNELIERCFKDDIIDIDIIRKGKKESVSVKLEPSVANSILSAEYDKKPRYVVCAGLVFQPLQRDVINAQSVSYSDIALDLRDFIERGGVLKNDELVLLTKVLDDEINSQLPPIGSHPIVEKVNGVPVKSLAHLYSLLYPEHPPVDSPYITIELKGNTEGRPIILRRKDIPQANERIAREYNISKTACLDSNRESLTDSKGKDK